MNVPTLSLAEINTHQTFLALMWSLSHPGQVYHLPDMASTYPKNFIAIGETLLDLESSFYTPDNQLAGELARTTAYAKAPQKAAYHFYPVLVENTLSVVAQAMTGDLTYPDRAATLVIGCQLSGGAKLTLSGPGIRDKTEIEIGGVPAMFWNLRQRSSRYPLGWDIFLLAGNQVVGLPRTTQVTID